MKTNKKKGIEGLPLKYLAMLIVATIILAAFFHIINMIANTSLQGIRDTNQTLNSILNKSIGNILQQNSTT